MIGEIVMESLARIDTVAYVRFASVYKNFQAADDFDRFVSELRPGGAGRVSDDRSPTWPMPCALPRGAWAHLAQPGRRLRYRKGGPIVGRGWTQPGGRPHAETMALAQAGQAARGATAYVTLEPCAHHGHTPPCAEALIAAGVRPRRHGADRPRSARRRARPCDAARRGHRRHRKRPEAEAAALNAGFLKRVTQGLPFVTLKLATTLDGRIATAIGRMPLDHRPRVAPRRPCAADEP